MSVDSRRRVGLFVSPFLALLTLGLPKPGPASSASVETIAAVETETAIGEPPQAAALTVSLEAAIAPHAACAAAAETPVWTPAVKSFDWDKAGEFQLAARLSVNRQLNKPKTTGKPVRTRQIDAAPRVRTSAAPAVAARPVVAAESAEILDFPPLAQLQPRPSLRVAA